MELMDAEALRPFFLIGLLMCFAVVFALAPLLVARLLAPRKPGRVKNQTYECGLESRGDPWVQFKAHYYVYAIAFVIFDIEAVFLYPWAASMTKIGIGGFLAMMFFFLMVVEGLVYLWSKGVLQWE